MGGHMAAGQCRGVVTDVSSGAEARTGPFRVRPPHATFPFRNRAAPEAAVEDAAPNTLLESVALRAVLI